MEKKVSVIVPIYNSGKYLKDCIESLLSQTYENFELLLINDGSTDESGKICKSFLDDRIRYFEQSNNGVSSARNKGIKESKGELISFADSDDRLSPRYLEELVRLSDRFNTDLTICTFKSIDAKGAIVDIYKPEWDKDVLLRGEVAKKELIEKILANSGNRRPVMAPYCKLYRADIIKKNCVFFDESLPIGEDFLFNLLYAQHINSVLFRKKVLYYRIEREGSAVMSCRPYIYKELGVLFKRYLNIKARYNIRPSTEKLFFFNKVNDSLGLYIFRSNTSRELNHRVNKLYKFLSSKQMRDIWNSITIKDLPDKKNKIKYLMIRNRLVSIWSLLKKLKE